MSFSYRKDGTIKFGRPIGYSFHLSTHLLRKERERERERKIFKIKKNTQSRGRETGWRRREQQRWKQET